MSSQPHFIDEYVEAIEEDVRWLGFEWARELYASDYFEQLYDMAVALIKAGKARKVAITACMRKLLVWLNAIVRDQKPWDPTVHAIAT